MDNAVAVIRVSSISQGMRGDSPEDQKQQIERYAQSRKIRIKKYFLFMDSASKQQQPVQEAIDYCIKPQNHIQLLIIKSIDRFTRGGSSLYDLMKTQLNKHGVKLIDLYGVIGNQDVNTLEHLGVAYSWSIYNPTKKSELLEAERGKDEMRDIMTRMIGAEIRYVRMGYYVRAAPFGYQNHKIETIHGKRNILIPHPTESKWIIQIFKLKAQGILSDLEIIQQINLSGFKSRKYSIYSQVDRTRIIGSLGGKPLTMKYFDMLVKKPIYAGINCEKWTGNKPVKCLFPGLISIETFNQANRGKLMILENENEIKIIKGNHHVKRLVNSSKSHFYPYKKLVLCPICRQPFFASASIGRLGKYYPAYHCNKRGHYYRIPLEKFHKTVVDFLTRVRIKDKYTNHYQEIFTKQLQEKNQITDTKLMLINRRIKEIEIEIKLNLQKLDLLSTDIAIKSVEQKLKMLENENIELVKEKKLIRNRLKADINPIQLSKAPTNRIPEYLINDHNVTSRIQLFGYLFSTTPTFEELEKYSARLNKEFKIYPDLEMVMEN